MNALFSTALFAPIQYYSALIKSEKAHIEAHENYIKQSYRNRYSILSANGIIHLSIPIAKELLPKIPIKEARISYDDNWQKQHLKTLESAYQSSPFYEFYIDDFLPFYTQKHKYLFDLNNNIQETILKLIEFENNNISFTKDYIENTENYIDYRNSINPKRINQEFCGREYLQVFDDKFGFIPNLSILDMIFNLGPETLTYLK